MPNLRSRVRSVVAGLSAALGLLVLTSNPACAQSPATLTPALPTLRTAQEIRSLSAAEAAREYPVLIRAVVTYSDKNFNVMWVQDRTAGVFISLKPGRTAPHPRAGELVEVRGFSKPGEFSPCAREAETKILGPGHDLRPARPTFAQLMTGRFTSQFVELEGTFHSGKIEDRHLLLNLHTSGGNLRVSMEEYPADWKQTVVHSKVRLRGALSANFNTRRQIIGVHLFVPKGWMEILEPPESDPFALPHTPLERLGRFSVHGTPQGRVHVKGTVTAVDANRAVYVSNNVAPLMIRPEQATPVRPGDLIEAVGYFSISDNRPTLEDALVRGIGRGNPVRPVPVSGNVILPATSGRHGEGTTYDLAVVTIEGTLLRVPTDGKDRSLLLQEDRGVFAATLGSAAADLPQLEPGSLLRLQGVCLVSYNRQYQSPESFQILLRDSADVAVLKEASWWNLRHSLWVVAATATCIPLVLAWVSLLRKQVAKQTQLIRATLHAEAEVESRYRRLFERNLAAFARTTIDGRFLDCNPAAARLLGVPLPKNLIGRNLQEFCLDPTNSVAALLRMPQDGSQLGTDLALRDDSGATRWALTSAIAAHDEGGTDPVVECTFIDITQRRGFETALRNSEEKYRTLFDCISQPVFIADAVSGRFVDCNLEVVRKYGYSLEDLRSMRVDDLQDRSSPAEVAETGVTPNRSVHLTKTGQPLDVELTSEEIEYEGRTAVMTIVRDVTRQRRFERELMSARDAAEAANRTKSEFLANMSHEIRTPLNGVLGMAELALDGDLPAEEREYLKTLKLSADSLLTVINDILDFSKIEAGKLDLEHVAFDLRGTIGDTLKTVAARAVEKNLELILDVEDDVPVFVMGDPTRLRQVILNLVGNAIKFTSAGDVSLRVAKNRAGELQPTLLFEVKDTGIGIAPHKQSSVFEAFSQADGSTTRRYGGTGLGLTICSRLVTLMGGRVWVDSEVGRGSQFSFTIPLEVASKLEASEMDPLLTAVTLKDVRVLAVDDHAANRAVLDRMLRNLGMQVSTFPDAPSACEALLEAASTEQPYDLLISDVNMDEMDGFDLVEHVRLNSQLASLPIILLASAGRAGDAARCRDLTVSAYVTKPISRGELQRAISSAMGAKAAEQAREGLKETLGLLSLNILLAEDNAVNQAVATRLLQKKGHRVQVASNGLEALQAFDRQAFDLILMDVQMPTMDGLDATRSIRERESATGSHIPIIAMTAHAMKGDADRCLDAGMDAYLCKPVSAAKLYGAISEVTRQTEAVCVDG